MRNAARFVLAFTLLTGLLNAQQPTSEAVVTGADELVKEQGLFKETWIRPDTDITRYSKLYIWEPIFQFREIDPARRTSSLPRDNEGPYGFREESREKFEQIASEAFAKEFQSSKMFKVVDTVGPGTLIVRPGVLDIVSNVPPDHPGRRRLYLTSVGEATIFFELVDADTGVIQARVAERRAIQPFGIRAGQITAVTPPTNPASVWVDVERWAASAARDLRKELEKAQKKAGES
jgi:hypothetical protein